MKHFLLAIAIGSGICAAGLPAQAREYNEGTSRGSYGWMEFGNLDGQINHLNRMVGHIRWQLTRYHPDMQTRREFGFIRGQVDRVNGEFRSGHYDRRQMRHRIEELRGRLHGLEERMHVRSNDYYNWR